MVFNERFEFLAGVTRYPRWPSPIRGDTRRARKESKNAFR